MGLIVIKWWKYWQSLLRNTTDTTCSLSLINWDRWFSFSMRLLCSVNSWIEMYLRLLSCLVFRSPIIVSWLEIFSWSSIIFCVETEVNILIKTIRMKGGERKGNLCHPNLFQGEKKQKFRLEISFVSFTISFYNPGRHEERSLSLTFYHQTFAGLFRKSFPIFLHGRGLLLFPFLQIICWFKHFLRVWKLSLSSKWV